MQNNYTTTSDWFDIKRLYGINGNVNFICDNIGAPILENHINIFVNAEPYYILNIRDYLIKNHLKYDYIITHDNDVLNKCPNARKFYFGSTWINKEDYENIDISIKKFKISTLIGSKRMSSGHLFRQNILQNQRQISNLIVYRSGNEGGQNEYGNEILRGNKIKLFKEYQYSLIIENGQSPNFFTEKIIDCLICKTIPIYYGDPNISNVFDTSNWIILDNDNINTAISKLNSIPSTLYNDTKLTIDKNYELSIYYSDFYKNISRVLETL